MLAAAIDRWADAGASAEQVAAMRGDRGQHRRHDRPYSARASPAAILIDSDAAGHGWFVDATPGEDGEFGADGLALEPAAGPSGRIDLLTALMHELGHQAGLDHDQSESDEHAFLLTG